MDIINTTRLTLGDDPSSFCDLDSEYLNKNYPDWLYPESFFEIYELSCYEEGFHSISEKTFMENPDNFRSDLEPEYSAFKCIIPKGSTYVEDFVGFIVSDKIIIKEKYEQ